MSGECYHCKQWIEDGEEHDCWTTTEAALTQELSDDLLDAWERLRETAVSFGDQRIYASHKSIMFSRKSCYFDIGAELVVEVTLQLDAVFSVRHGKHQEYPCFLWAYIIREHTTQLL